MSVLRSSPVAAAWRWLRERLPVRPRAYWTTRHERFRGSLSGPGRADLPEEDNARDYAERRARLRAILAPLARPREDGARPSLLDAGCGTGLFFADWLELGFDPTGMDFASAEARAGRGPHGVPVLLGDICELPPEPRRDVITCIDVLFHVLSDRKWERFLQTACAALAPQGRLLVQEQLVAEDAWRGVEQHCHFRRASDYARAAAKAGLVLVAHERYALPRSGVTEDVLLYARAADLPARSS